MKFAPIIIIAPFVIGAATFYIVTKDSPEALPATEPYKSSTAADYSPSSNYSSSVATRFDPSTPSILDKNQRRTPASGNADQHSKANLQRILLIGDPVRRNRELQTLLDQTPLEALPELETLLSAELNLGFFPGVRELFIHNWVSKDPFSAMKHYGKNKAHYNSYELAFSTWARQDSIGSIAWVNNLEDSKDADNLRNAAAASLALHDQDLSRKILFSAAPNQRRSYTAANIAKKLVFIDVDKSFEWIENLPKDAEISNITKQFIDSSTVQNPEKILAWVDKTQTGNDRIEMLSTGLKRWVHQDPKKVTQWHAKQNPETQIATAPLIAQDLAYKDMDTALKWINSHSGDQRFDKAKILVAEMQHEADSPAAIATLEAISRSNSNFAQDAQQSLNRLEKK